MVLVMAVRTSSRAMPLAASLVGSSSTLTAGSAPPAICTLPTPSTWAMLCDSTVEAASYIWPRVMVFDVRARMRMGVSAVLAR